MSVKEASEAVMTKIKRLLKLSDAKSNSNEHERDQALAAAMKLMQEYNLEREELEAEDEVEVVSEDESDVKYVKWVTNLAVAVSELTYTKVIKRCHKYSTKQIYVFIGTPSNTAVARELLRWLRDSIQSESLRRWSIEVERRSFRMGAGSKVAMRVLDMIAEEKNTGSSSKNALMVIRNKHEDQNVEYVSNNYPGMKNARTRRTVADKESFMDGVKFGSTLPIERKHPGERKTVSGSTGMRRIEG